MNPQPYVETHGHGEPIVFIHGSFATTATWRKIIEPLVDDHLCILIKLPGHGGAPAPTDFHAPSMDTELNIIEAVVRQLTDRPIHLVGHSYGGVVALALALEARLPIRRLSLYEPVAVWLFETLEDHPMAAQMADFVGRYRHDAARDLPEVCAQVIDFWGGQGSFAPLPDKLKQTMAALTPDNLRHWDLCTSTGYSVSDLRRLSCPTDLVCGSRSNAVAHAIVDHLHAQLPDSGVYRVDGASHFLVTTHPDACRQILTATASSPVQSA